jgi:hypothetical protein
MNNKDLNQLMEPIDKTTRAQDPAASLTKREYFAALAMQGILANSYNDGRDRPSYLLSEEMIARLSVTQADVLVKILNEVNDEKKA